MNIKTFATAATALTALSMSSMADARSLRAVGSSTVYPFAKAVAERVARANPRWARRSSNRPARAPA